MNRIQLFCILLCAFCLPSAEAQQHRLGGSSDGDVSLKLEIERGINKGIQFLKTKQNKETGSWDDPQLPAFTALAISSILNAPSRKINDTLPPSVEKGCRFLIKNQKPDGGIYGKGLATYNTSLSIMALSLSGRKEYLPYIAKARRLLINQQQDYDRRGQTDNLFDGGIGYGGSYAHSDLSNSHLAMEALYYSKKVLSDTEFDESNEFDLDWDAAIDFVSRCQNSETTSKRLGSTIEIRDQDRGGFVYFPGDTKSEEIELKNGKVALRSYGSMSYAGLLAFIYAEMDQEDPRIKSALNWLQQNYTLEENPGLETQGLYYYYHTMAKALSLAQVEQLNTPKGKINWKKTLALKILSQQSPDGSWTNSSSNRWMEDNPILVSSYSLLALSHVYHSL